MQIVIIFHGVFILCHVWKKDLKSRINDKIIRSHHLLLFVTEMKLNKTSVAHDFGGFEMNLRLLSTTKRLFSTKKGWNLFNVRQSSYAGTGTHEPIEPRMKHTAPHMWIWWIFSLCSTYHLIHLNCYSFTWRAFSWFK